MAATKRQSRQAKSAANRRRSHYRVVPKGASAVDHDNAAIRARKVAHRNYLRRTLENLETEEGMARFLVAREVNPHLTPLACAAIAYSGREGIVYRGYACGKGVGGYAETWKARGSAPAKNEYSFVFGTKPPNFNPQPLFGEDQLIDAMEYDPADNVAAIGEPAPSLLAAAVGAVRQAFQSEGYKAGALNGWLKVSGL